MNHTNRTSILPLVLTSVAALVIGCSSSPPGIDASDTGRPSDATSDLIASDGLSDSLVSGPRVETFMGSGPCGPSSSTQPGQTGHRLVSIDNAFADGPAAQALVGSKVLGLVEVGDRLLFTDTNSHALRQLRNGVVTTLNSDTASKAPPAGYRDGVLEQARFDRPRGMAVDSRGRIYIADSNNCSVRRVILQ